MKYREFGKTGISISALGFGCMRLPMTMRDGKSIVDDEHAAPLLQRAAELGINFFDTAWFYCGGDSQRAVGAALRKVRDTVYISTKLPLFLVNRAEDFEEYLERSLEQMGLDYLDFNHFHGLTYSVWKEKILPLKLLDRAERAKSRGLIKNLAFSFHGDADKMKELIDTGAFSSLLGQYNLVDRRNESVFEYAKNKGVGTAVMGPLMGGNITDGGDEFLRRMGVKCGTAAELGLRFVWGNPDVDTALSGMNSISQLEENVKYAGGSDSIPAEERRELIERSCELESLGDLYCTGCHYCMVCPEGIKPGRIFQMYIQKHVWGLTGAVRRQLEDKGPFGAGVEPSSCTKCGVCSKRCPQKIDIPSELRRVWPEVKSCMETSEKQKDTRELDYEN